MAMNSWELLYGTDLSPNSGVTASPQPPPERRPESRSIIRARPKPLAPPIGSSMPLMASFGSVVTVPAASVAQSPGMLSPEAAARRILPMAAWLVAMSKLRGLPEAVGSAMATGLLPTRRSAPPGAGISGRVLLMTTPTLPLAAARSA